MGATDPLTELQIWGNAFEWKIDAATEALNEEFDQKWKDATEEWTQEMQKEVFEAIYWKKEKKTKKSKTEAINSRYEANTWLTQEEVQEKLTDDTEREKNKDKALKLFYNEWSIKGIIKWTSTSEDAQKKLEKFNSEDYQEDLQKIMWNFVTDVEWETLVDVFRDWEWSEDSGKILESLNLAFEMQINKVTEWKANYDTEIVDDLITELRDWDPFEKLDIFEKIKSLVNTWEWKNSEKSSKVGKKINEWREKEKVSLEKRFDDFIKQVQLSQKTWDKEKAKDLLIEGDKLIDEADKWWDVYNIIWEIDIMMHDLRDVIEYT